MGKVETLTDFIFLGSKITSDSDCSHEIKRCLLLGNKSMTNLDGTLQSRDITLLTKILIVKAMVYPMVMYSCESWTIKKAESESEVTQSCPTLCDPMDCSPPGSSVHAILFEKLSQIEITDIKNRLLVWTLCRHSTNFFFKSLSLIFLLVWPNV